jgi:REP element-mobilizing transposase RayT
MAIYLDDRDREMFLSLLARAFDIHGVECHAYCLMANHYHLVVTTNEPNLSSAIQHLNSPYAQWWNQRHSRPGHVFQGRFGAQVVQHEAYLLTACRYVVLNPVRAGLVSCPEQWQWSSYRATAGLEAVPPYLQPEVLWHTFGTSKVEHACRAYRRFVAMGDERRLPCEPVLGDERFQQLFADHRRAGDHEMTRRERRSRPPIARLFAGAVSREARVGGASAAFAHGYSLREIARFMGLHYTTVSRMVRQAARGQVVDEPDTKRSDPGELRERPARGHTVAECSTSRSDP